jgi:hypothetical protein
MFTNRRPYYGLKMSTTDFFREPVRYLKESNTQESMMEKPYLGGEYPKMHLSLPDFKFKPREIPSVFGPIANEDPIGGLAFIDFGEARCHWGVTRTSDCVEGSVMITLIADYLWHAEFEFNIAASGDTKNIAIETLPNTRASGWDKQSYLLTFPENYNGTISICGIASTNTLISQTFETVVAGQPVGIHLVHGALMPIERGQSKPAKLLSSSYGSKGDDCGCIEILSNCAACNSSVGYTTQQMSVDGSQTLTVLNPGEGCNYQWDIVSGGGSMDGSTYTAPHTNVDCANNPTITLTANGVLQDVVQFAVNASDGLDVGYVYEKITYAGGFPECTQTTGTCNGCYVHREAYSAYDILNCDGTTSPSGWLCGDPNNIERWSCTYCDDGADCGDSACPGPCEYPLQETIRHNCRNTRGNEDQRTEAELADGCCPQQLI